MGDATDGIQTSAPGNVTTNGIRDHYATVSDSAVVFVPPSGHRDAVIRAIQDWLTDHPSTDSPIEEMVDRSGLPESTFKRRFKQATGYSPIQYVQLLRVEEAKRRLEGTGIPIDEISWQVGYENTAFFRRLFKRTTRMTPAEYRRKFQIPDFAQAD